MSLPDNRVRVVRREASRRFLLCSCAARLNAGESISFVMGPETGMRTHWLNAAVSIGLVLVAGFFLLAGIYPYRPNSTIGWFILFVLALPVTLVLEYGGEKLLNPGFVSHLGHASRITYGVFVAGIWLVVVLVAFQFLEPYFGKWGS